MTPDMATETERKFLLSNSGWRDKVFAKKEMAQGYLTTNPERTVRVRISNQKGYITIKGKTQGNTRPEFEYAIPVADAEQLIKLCEKPLIVKTRHLVRWAGKVWEIDEFHGVNKGLIVVEVELTNPDEHIDLPAWAGQEVSHLRRYFNASLIHYPYSHWSDEEK
jgi:adenylate cyclase